MVSSTAQATRRLSKGPILPTLLKGLPRWRFAMPTVALICLFSQPAHSQLAKPQPQDQPSQQTATPQDDESNDSQPKPSLLTPLKPQPEKAPYHPITLHQRMRWIVTNSIGPAHLAGGAISAGFGTALDRPEEYGTHWGGFGERFGIRLTGIVPGNIMEAGIGTIWGEDPRYFRVPDKPFRGRLRNIVMQTFKARQRDGTYAPAYARFIAIPGNNFLSNLWRADSEANTHDAIIRSVDGFAGRVAANAFEEFWPDVKHKLFHKRE